jgi:hypothetical protein
MDASHISLKREMCCTCPNVYETRVAQEVSRVEFPVDNLFYAVK